MPKNAFNSFKLIQEIDTGIIECTFNAWNKTLYKLSRDISKSYKDDERFRRSGIYFLFAPNCINLSAINVENGKYELSVRPSVYIGKGAYREESNQGLLYRVHEKHKNEKNWSDSWTEALILVSDSFEEDIDRTELSYLEKNFYSLAQECNQYDVFNAALPEGSGASKQRGIDFETDFQNTLAVISVLGYKVFDHESIQQIALNDNISISQESSNNKDSETANMELPTGNRDPFSFFKCGIKEGETICYDADLSITATVLDARRVLYKGQPYYLSKLTQILMSTKKAIQGQKHWLYKGKILTKLREELEEAGLYK